jgi:hypothetical protein
MHAFPHRGHEGILTEALRAPSAHNAQAWRLAPLPGGSSYELHYDHLDYLPSDPEDRDAYLALGGFFETLSLAAERAGYVADFAPAFEREGSDLLVGVISLEPDPAGAHPGRLALAAPRRATNRYRYRRTPLPAGLRQELTELGCAFVSPRRIRRLIVKANVMCWTDPRFVADLKTWTRFSPGSPDGLGVGPLALSGFDRVGLRFALRRGRVPSILAPVYASRDIRLTKACSELGVLSVDSMSPQILFDAGRRLVRAWVTAAAWGYSCHPVSIVIDYPTATELERIMGVTRAVALFRIGYTEKVPPLSGRRNLHDVLRLPAGRRGNLPLGANS